MGKNCIREVYQRRKRITGKLFTYPYSDIHIGKGPRMKKKKKMYRLIPPRHLGYILTVQSYSLYTFRVYQHQSFKLC